MTAQFEQFKREKDHFFKHHPHSPIPHAERGQFTSLSYFPYNEALNLTLKTEEFEEKQSIQMSTSTGDIRDYMRWGEVHFEVEGEPARLTLYFSPEIQHFFLPFMDATSATETYSAGRYLDPQIEEDGSVHLDFNYAYSPYCAYNDNYSCPIPPKENRLSVRIEAGEKLMGE